MTAKQRITDDIIRCSVHDCENCGFRVIGSMDDCKQALICAAALILDGDDDDRTD